MPHYATTISSPKPPSEVFAYLSDFSTTQEWDPGVAEAQRLFDGPVAEGSEFRVVADFMGRKVPLTYVVTALDAPRRVVLRGENSTTVSLDEITVEPDGTGSRVTYDAQLSLKGVAKVLEPGLALVFKRIGDRATDGLRAALKD